MYIALLQQKGEGCDYMIGCGKTWIRLNAENWESAMIELHKKIIGRPNNDYVIGYDGDFLHAERELENAILLEVSKKENAPIQKWYGEVKKAQALKEAEIQRQKEISILKDLKKKYPNA